jgi:hypothetical protein
MKHLIAHSKQLYGQNQRFSLRMGKERIAYIGSSTGQWLAFICFLPVVQSLKNIE